MGRRWWGEVKSHRSKVDITHIYIGVGDDNDIIQSVARCQSEQVQHRSKTCWGSALLGRGMPPYMLKCR